MAANITAVCESQPPARNMSGDILTKISDAMLKGTRILLTGTPEMGHYYFAKSHVFVLSNP